MVQAACGRIAILFFISHENLQLKTTVGNCLNFYNAVTISVVSVVVEVYVLFGE